MNKPTTEELLKALVPVSTSCWGRRGENIDMHIIHLNDERYQAICAIIEKYAKGDKKCRISHTPTEKGQPKVSREFVEKWNTILYNTGMGEFRNTIKAMLREAGVGVEE